MSARPQLHVSHLSMIAKCGIQFQYRYGEKFGIGDRDRILPPSIALARGTAVHKSVQVNLQSKIDVGAPLALAEAKQVAFDSAEKLWKDEIDLRPDEKLNEARTRGEFLDSSVEMAALHATRVAPQIEPLEVEKAFVIELKGYPFDLAGQIDVVEERGIRDTKTSGKTPSVNAARSLQMAMYSQAIRTSTGSFPESASLDYLVKLKTSTKYVCCETVPDDDFVQPLFRRIEQATQLIESVQQGVSGFTPADPDHWICSSKWCGYHSICPYYSGK